MDVRDTKLKGFVLRVRPSGSHSYSVNYRRTDGAVWQNVRYLVGTTDKLTAPEAREEAGNA